MGTSIITYHSIGRCSRTDDRHAVFLDPEVFARQMETLAKHFSVVPLAEAVSSTKVRGRPRVAVTFDDGYRSLLDTALPILESHGFPAAVFVATDVIGDRNRWDEPSPCGLEIMTAEEIREAATRGITIESHGHTHCNYTAVPLNDVTKDLTLSLEILEEITGQRPRFFAYPYGYTNREVQAAISEIGVDAAFTCGVPHDGQYAWARAVISRTDPGWLFRMQARSSYPKVRYSSIVKGFGMVYRRFRPRRGPDDRYSSSAHD